VAPISGWLGEFTGEGAAGSLNTAAAAWCPSGKITTPMSPLMMPQRKSWAQRRLVLAIWLVVHAGMERLAGRLPFAGIARSR